MKNQKAWADLSLDERMQTIREDLSEYLNPPVNWPMVAGEERSWCWIAYVYDAYVIVCCDDEKFRLDYTVDDNGEVTPVGQLQPVVMDWKPAKGFWYAGNPADDSIKIGARNNQRDQANIQSIHDMAVENGATCSGKAVPARNNPLKTVGKTDDELRVGNHIILFGGRDLTGVVYGKNVDGSSGEFFTANTDCESTYTKTGVLHVDFEHGQDPDNVGISGDDVLGYVDWKTAKKDEQGIFVERVLNRRSQYVQWLEGLIDEGLVGNSSEAIGGKTQKAKNGEILKWPLRRDTLTVNPMEPRMLSENAYTAIRNLSQVFPALKSLLPAPVAAALPVGNETAEPTKSNPIHEVNMTPEEIQTMIDSAVTKATEEFKKALPANVKAGASEPAQVKDANSRPYQYDKNVKGDFQRALGENLIDIKNLQKGKGMSRRMEAVQAEYKAAGMSEFISSDGGYALQPDFSVALLDRVYMPPGMGSVLADVTRQPVSGNGFRAVVVDETTRVSSRRGGFIGYWLAEGMPISSSKPQFRRIGSDLEKVAALTYLTDELLSDAPALGTWVDREGSNELRFQVEDKIFNGTGGGVPIGINTANAMVTVAKETGQASGTIVTENITKMWARMPAYLMPTAKWYINQELLPQLVTLSIAVGVGGQIVPVSIYRPPTGVNGDYWGTLFGRPIQPVEYCAALGTLGDILLAAMGEYFVIDNGGIQTASSIHVNFTSDETALRFLYRANGFPFWNAAMTPYKGTNTLSPFINLAAR